MTADLYAARLRTADLAKRFRRGEVIGGTFYATETADYFDEVLAALDQAKGALSDLPSLPDSFKWTGTERAEDLFDAENRHKNGTKPHDYLVSWLSMLRPFAFATRDDSWGEMEKLLCIVMRNYVQTIDRAAQVHAQLTNTGADKAGADG